MKLTGFALVAVLLVLGLAACGGGSSSGNESPTDAAANGDSVACTANRGEGEEIGAAKLLFEYQSTDGDTGIHGLFDTSGWSELCVYGPDGEEFLAVQPRGELANLGMAGIFFESREPLEEVLSQEEIIGMFPEGEYEVAAISFDGSSITGAATLTHDIPVPPVVTVPEEGDVVDPDSLVVEWEPVVETVGGAAAEITGYEVIVTNEDIEDPNGFSQPVLSAHVLPTVTRFTIPSEFLEDGTEYELEVIALEESGNQTITVVFFETQ